MKVRAEFTPFWIGHKIVDRAELDPLKAAKLEALQNEMLSRLARSDADYLAAAAEVEAAKTPEEVEAVKLTGND